MKKSLLVFVVTALFLVSCASAPVEENGSDEMIIPEEVYEVEGTEIESYPESDYPAESIAVGDIAGLTNQEISGIVFMREEEKLARDVYLQLAELWDMNIFQNIAGSEDTHMGAVLTLIEMADVEDPVEGFRQGEFLNQDLQELYFDLVARGGQSLAEALLVGAAIEEIDILDLQMYLAETDDESIKEVYQNLLQGSINHLNSFVRTYERQTGNEYQPQFLTEEAFQELINITVQGKGDGQQGRNDQSRGWGKTN